MFTFSCDEKDDSTQKKEIIEEPKEAEKEVPESMDCEEPVMENKNDSPKTAEIEETPVPTTVIEDKPKASEQASAKSNENGENQNIPENFMVMQINKETNGTNKEEEESKEPKENICATNGNEESQCSVDEPNTEIQNCYW